MRLIDGDELIELINGGYDLDFEEVPETKRELLRMIMEQPTVDAIPVDMIGNRIKGLKAMLENIDEDEHDAIWHLRTEIQTLTELTDMWAEREEDDQTD